jgi:maleylacetoacetate isomerase
MKLYTFHRNSAGERVRIALNLKGLRYEYVSAPSLPPGELRHVNPQGLIPVLELDGQRFAQSLAILDFLERRFPDPPLLPADPFLRAQSLSFGAHVASEIHALGIGRVRKFLGTLGVEGPGIERWQEHWVREGLTALESMLAQREHATPFCYGEAPGWADLHLVPQLRKARREGFDLTPYPLLRGVEARCLALDAFVRAGGEHQPDWTG